MKTKFIILAIIFIVLILPGNALANTEKVQNIIWQDDYNIKFDEVENATLYKYNLSVNSNKAPTTLFPIKNFECEDESISFFPIEALEHFNSSQPAVYRVWIIAFDENSTKLTELTPSTGGKIINFSKLNIENKNLIDDKDSQTEKEQDIKIEESEKLKETNKPIEINKNNDSWENPFEDVSENAWYYGPIKFSNQNNLLTGITDNEFAPKAPMTRGMLAQVLYKHSQDDSTKNYSLLFSDVKESAYYYNAIAWICENNISAGMGKNMFKPNEPITREQLITMLYNYSIYLGKDVKSVALDFSQFEDSDAIQSWAKVPLCWALKNNLIGGRTESILAPHEAATRAEFATILMRFLNI